MIWGAHPYFWKHQFVLHRKKTTDNIELKIYPASIVADRSSLRRMVVVCEDFIESMEGNFLGDVIDWAEFKMFCFLILCLVSFSKDVCGDFFLMIQYQRIFFSLRLSSATATHVTSHMRKESRSQLHFEVWSSKSPPQQPWFWL